MKQKKLKEEKQIARIENKAKRFISIRTIKGKGLGKGKDTTQDVEKRKNRKQRVEVKKKE